MSKGKREALEGLLVVDKPVGWSSMDVVRRVRRAAGGAKTGHAGTLDPLASGVVVCCLGRATKAVPRLMDRGKVYLAEVDLSAFTTTDDREGERHEVAVSDPPDEARIDAVLRGFLGVIQQVPPAHSAVHVGGQRAYQRARRGESVELDPRPVRIDAIERLAYTWPLLSIRICCGKGTYIRSLARDVGQALGCGGHLATLRREAVGEYTLARAVTAERLESPLTPEALLPIPPVDA